jgi:hypothetical protein
MSTSLNGPERGRRETQMQTTREIPAETAMTAGFRPRPNHVGSIHDDTAARQYGYRSALVPGIILYGYMANLVAESWGLDWLARGTMSSQSRRPVYEGDPIVIHAQSAVTDAEGVAVEMEVLGHDGRILASGRATLPDGAPTLPDMAEFPVLPIEEPPRPIAAGGFRRGDRFGCEAEVMTPEDHRESLEYFRQTWPVFAEQGVVHPTRLPHLATRNALASYALPTPSIFVSAWTQHLGLVRVGDRLTTSGVITDVYERKGNQYIDQRHLVIANDTQPVALVRRTSIYAARKEA